MGPRTVHLADGRQVGTTTVIIKRQIWTRVGLIVEDSVTLDARSGSKPKSFATIARWDGSQMSIIEKNDAFRGVGTLVGKPGHWTAWNSHSVMPDGSRIDSEDRLAAGVLKVRKRVLKPGGELIVELREALKVVGAAEYQAALAGIGVTAP